MAEEHVPIKKEIMSRHENISDSLLYIVIIVRLFIDISKTFVSNNENHKKLEVHIINIEKTVRKLPFQPLLLP